MDKQTTLLYISYNSLTDQLAQSQVLPYLIELGKLGYKFVLISCEKKEAFEKEKDQIFELCRANNINWYPLFYQQGFSVFSKFIDVRNIKKLARQLFAIYNYTAVHCRSYIASLAGLYLKKKFAVKFIFDSREFWPDEQVENGTWNLKNPLYKLIYIYFKKKEKQFARYADAIINLSDNGKKIFCNWYPIADKKTFVVPCTADFDHYKPNIELSKNELRQQLNLPADVPILVHLGALAPNYLINETIDFYTAYRHKFPHAVLLFLCKTQHEYIRKILTDKQVDQSAVIITSANRQQVPDYLSAADIGLCFMITCPAKKSASPIKIGEYAAVDLPVAATDVGDVKELYNTTNCGIVIEKFTEEAYQQAILQLEQIDRSGIRKKMAPFFSLPKGVAIYEQAYNFV